MKISSAIGSMKLIMSDAYSGPDLRYLLQHILCSHYAGISTRARKIMVTKMTEAIMKLIVPSRSIGSALP